MLANHYHTQSVQSELSGWERYVVGSTNDTLARVARAALPEGARLLLEQAELQGQFKLLRGLGSKRVGVFAYCFCELR
jgi:hypothetical protein